MTEAAQERLNPIAVYASTEQQHWWYVTRRAIMELFVRQLVPPVDSPVVIDIGCGPGSNLHALSSLYSCFGIDTSQEAIDIAKERFPHVTYICGTAPDDLGTTVQRARMTLIMDVLEHVENDVAMLSGIVNAVPSGSYVFITVPAHPFLWGKHDESVGHYRRYTRESFQKLWQLLPVDEVFLSFFNTRLYPAIRAARWVNHKLGRSQAGKHGADTDIKIPIKPINALLGFIFRTEEKPLVDALLGRRKPPRYGVSLMAVLRKK